MEALQIVSEISSGKKAKMQDKYRFEFYLTSRPKKDPLVAVGCLLIESDDSVDVYLKAGDKVPVIKVSKDVFEAVVSTLIKE